MFLLVSGRHVDTHPDGHQHGVSAYIYIISCVRNIGVIYILARVFEKLLSFLSQILDVIYWAVFIFSLIYFKWRDTENQQ